MLHCGKDESKGRWIGEQARTKSRRFDAGAMLHVGSWRST